MFENREASNFCELTAAHLQLNLKGMHLWSISMFYYEGENVYQTPNPLHLDSEE